MSAVPSLAFALSASLLHVRVCVCTFCKSLAAAMAAGSAAVAVGQRGENAVIDSLEKVQMLAEKTDAEDDQEGNDLCVHRDMDNQSGSMNVQVKTTEAKSGDVSFTCKGTKKTETKKRRRGEDEPATEGRANFYSYQQDGRCDAIIFVLLLSTIEFCVLPLCKDLCTQADFEALLRVQTISKPLDDFRELFRAHGLHAKTEEDLKGIMQKTFAWTTPDQRKWSLPGVATRSSAEELQPKKDSPMQGRGAQRKRDL